MRWLVEQSDETRRLHIACRQSVGRRFTASCKRQCRRRTSTSYIQRLRNIPARVAVAAAPSTSSSLNVRRAMIYVGCLLVIVPLRPTNCASRHLENTSEYLSDASSVGRQCTGAARSKHAIDRWPGGRRRSTVDGRLASPRLDDNSFL